MHSDLSGSSVPLKRRIRRVPSLPLMEVLSIKRFNLHLDSDLLDGINLLEGDRVVFESQREAVDGDLVVAATPETMTSSGRVRQEVDEQDGKPKIVLDVGFIFRAPGIVVFRDCHGAEREFPARKVHILGVAVKAERLEALRYPFEIATVDDFPDILDLTWN